MEIKFNTKEQSKKEQEEAFLKLSPSDRFLVFLKISKQSLKLFPAKEKETENFVIQIPPQNG